MANTSARKSARPAGPEIGAVMAVALARALLAKGVLSGDDVAAMVAQMEDVATSVEADRPNAAKATRLGARNFRHALASNPGIIFPLVLTAG